MTRERELEALRKQPPEEWLSWAREHGSETLKRALREHYPFAQLLRSELIDLFAPPRLDAQRSHELTGWRVQMGDEREPNAESFRMLDAIQSHARAAFAGPKCPAKTELTLLRLRRAHLEHGCGDIAYGSAGGIELSCRDCAITAYYIWGRSDFLGKAAAR